MDTVVAHGWWPEAGGAGHKRALCLVAAGAGLLTGGAFLLCAPPPEHREWIRNNDPHETYTPQKMRNSASRTPSSVQKLLDPPKPKPKPEPEPEPEPEPQPRIKPQILPDLDPGQPVAGADAEIKPDPVSPPPMSLQRQKQQNAPRSPVITPKSPQFAARSLSSSSGMPVAPLAREVSWGSAAFDRARQATPSELRKAFDQMAMTQSHSKDLWKLGEPGAGSIKVLSKDDFLHICTDELDLDLNGSEIERLFDQLDETKAGTLNFEQFRRAVNRSSFFKTIASNYNSPVRPLLSTFLCHRALLQFVG
eukprot:COSAG02_NODE_220_length_28426_cov_28.546863_1_plen_307_part_00